VNDVTAHDLLQSTLLGEALEHASVGIVVFDAEGTYLAVNRYAAELLGYSRDEFLTLSPRDLSVKPPAEIDEALAALARDRRANGTTTVRRKDGETVGISSRAFATHLAGMDVFVSIVEPVRRAA
jgi:PAS domain S-box-containing protein